MRTYPRLSAAASGHTYVAASAAVIAAYAARYLAQPVVGDNHPYSLFFPVVLLCAYAFGRGPAAFAAALAASLAYWTFVEPRFGVALHPAALAPLALFVITAGVAIYLITGLTAALAALARDQGRLHATADAHAHLFRNLQARIAHHMTLLVGVLSLQARGEPDPEILVLLRKAGERSQLIARAHRDLAGGEGGEVEFAAFATSLARSICVEAGLPADRVQVEPAPLRLPLELATSLGVALAECLAWIVRRQSRGVTRVQVAADGDLVRLRVSHDGEAGAEPIALAPAAFMFRAMVEQLGAAVRLSDEAEEPEGLEITVPLAAEPDSVRVPAATLH